MSVNVQRLGNISTITMGTSPKGSTYNERGEGLPLLNGPTEFGPHHPACTLFTTDPRRECETDDLIFCVRGSTTGRMNWADRKYALGRGVCSIQGWSREDTRFIRYALEVHLRRLLQFAGGTTFPNLTKDTLHDFTIPFPHNRSKIADVISAYDDLIENNRRRIQLLEQVAWLLYKEWFVHLRFPGHKHITITDGVPEGWSRVDLNSIIRIEHGYAFKGAYFSEEITPRILLTPGNFKMGGGIKLDKLKYYSTLGPLDEKYILKKDDLLITMTDLSKASDTLGYSLLVPQLNGKVFLHNQRLGAVYPKENIPFYRHFLDQLFKDFRYRSFVVGSASGTSVKHTSPKKILSYKPVLPSYEKSILIREFDDKMRFMNRQIHNLLQTNEKLAQARDLLLPRLMNGEVTV